MQRIQSKLPAPVLFENEAEGYTVIIYAANERQTPSSDMGVTTVTDAEFAFLQTQYMFKSLVIAGDFVIL